MWSDNETNRDFLNFRAVADTAAEMVIQAGGYPLSMGISGGWGVGKSSMIKLIADALKDRGNDHFLFAEFNAWLYQGYDDARAALMDVIARKLVAHAKKHKTGIEKAEALLQRIDWLRTAKLIGSSALSMAVGLPPTGLIGEACNALGRLFSGNINQQAMDTAMTTGKKVIEAGKSLISSPKTESPPKEIQDLRDHFCDTLKEMGITLVVLIDDLDRCLPNTAIATLEAIRLFLFLDNTAFIIAADDKMIRQSVRAHFKEMALDEDLVTNYFDKLIQVPIRVPPLGTQDVRAYIMLLFIENSGLPSETRDELRVKICKQLGESWQGKRVDRAFVASLIQNCPEALSSQLELADRLAPFMTTAKKIAGNPRLIKRFLNTLSIRLAIARSQHVTVDEAVLAKMLLFERCGNEEAYASLVKAINDSDEGKPDFLRQWEKSVVAGKEVTDLPAEWQSDFAKEWLALDPQLVDLDLRPVVYVSREHLPIITASDRLSSEAAELLSALLEIKSQVATPLVEKLRLLSKREIGLIMDRLLARARQVQEWGTPPILFACLTVLAADPDQASALTVCLRQLSGPQLSPALIPLLADKPWSKSVLSHWLSQQDTPGPVKRAIESEAKEKR